MTSEPHHPPLRKGTIFQIKTGPRLILYQGDHHYFQRKQRRYYCRIILTHHESYRDGWDRRRTRMIADVKVIDY